ncbi:hypothetical protein JD844_019148 [Phrynosoma platyrhinos]|uniref:Uncharacterized protein n=1 Tax=Phrynosoma platyrhinos TaxID=52577 RepID=A0ABQ7SPM1_PHRPL|nr:hypothetical protein JD844_019148 [Phrynosoma platyrhinos]
MPHLDRCLIKGGDGSQTLLQDNVICSLDASERIFIFCLLHVKEFYQEVRSDPKTPQKVFGSDFTPPPSVNEFLAGMDGLSTVIR